MGSMDGSEGGDLSGSDIGQLLKGYLCIGVEGREMGILRRLTTNGIWLEREWVGFSVWVCFSLLGEMWERKKEGRRGKRRRKSGGGEEECFY